MAWGTSQRAQGNYLVFKFPQISVHPWHPWWKRPAASSQDSDTQGSHSISNHFFHILTSQLSDIFYISVPSYKPCFILTVRVTSENWAFIFNSFLDIHSHSICPLAIFQKRKKNLKNYLIYENKTSHQSFYIVKLWAITFLCKLEMSKQCCI